MNRIETVDHDDWLAENRLRLQQAHEAHSAELHALTAATPDPADVDAHAAMLARTQRVIGEVTAALRRIDANTYGKCETCGRPIPRERLEALPHAGTCVSCPRRS